MENISGYSIKGLTVGEHRWRIDWFGSVTFGEQYRWKSQPLIEIQLSLVPDDLTDLNQLFSLENDQWPKTRQVRLPVGLLPALKIGDIWRNHQMVESPQYDAASFNSLWVDRNTTSIIKSGLSNDDGNSFYLPISHHPFHAKHTHSYCLLIKSETTFIVIPAIELIRFYFGSSSNLVARLFDAPFSPENLWVAMEPDDTGARPKIHLASGISGQSATDIGRIALSKWARAAAELIGNSCVAATANDQRAYPKAIFPFDGMTNLSASGKWLPFKGTERGVFLVFKLTSCSHPFPFASLRYTSERKHTSTSNTHFGKTSENSPDKHEKRFSKARQDTRLIVDEEPDKTKKPRRLSLFAGVGMQFPDLARKPVSKVDVDQVLTILHSLSGASIISGSSVGDHGTDSRVQPIELVGAGSVGNALTGNGTVANALTTAVFLDLTSRLLDSGRLVSVDIVRLDPRQRFDHLSKMPLIVDDDGEVSPTCVIPIPESGGDGQTTTRHRQISIGRALDVCAAYYFMVPESTRQSGAKVEFHLIVDMSKSIQTNADLQAAIAAQFSMTAQLGATIELGTGVTSVRFGATYIGAEGEQVKIISGKFHQYFESRMGVNRNHGPDLARASILD